MIPVFKLSWDIRSFYGWKHFTLRFVLVTYICNQIKFASIEKKHCKKLQNVQEILYRESYLWLSSSASHTPYLNNPFQFPQQTIKIPWNCKIIHFSTEASRLSTTRQDNIFPQYINELFSNNFFILSFPSGGHFSKKDQGECTYQVRNCRMPGTKLYQS